MVLSSGVGSSSSSFCVLTNSITHSPFSVYIYGKVQQFSKSDCEMRKRKVPHFRFLPSPSSPSAVTISDYCTYSKQCRYSLTPSSQQDNHITRFHPCFEENTHLSEDNTVAYRNQFYNNSVTFSEYPLKAGEIFLIEIGKSKYSSCLSMELGLAQSEALSACRKITSISHQYPPRVLRRRDIYWNVVPREVLEEGYWPPWCRPSGEKKFFTEGDFLKTSRGKIPLSFFKSTDEGSRVGIVFVPINKIYADMHLIINGKDYGPSRKKISYQKGPLHAAIRISCGGKVRIIQVHHMASLQVLCRDAIVGSLTNKIRGVNSLPLPEKLKDYLMEG